MKQRDREKFVYNELSTNKKIHKTLAITKIIGYNNNCIKKLERVGTNPTLKCVLREWNMSSIEEKIEKLVETKITNLGYELYDVQYVKEGKHHLVISIGCTGGRHRSVTLCNLISDELMKQGYRVVKKHRDFMLR